MLLDCARFRFIWIAERVFGTVDDGRKKAKGRKKRQQDLAQQEDGGYSWHSERSSFGRH